MMTNGITKTQARALMYQSLAEPLGILVYASDRQAFTQALYRARQGEPSLQILQIRQTPQGIAICHPPVERQDGVLRSDFDPADDDEGGRFTPGTDPFK